jgi:catecholate siderophore receptor
MTLRRSSAAEHLVRTRHRTSHSDPINVDAQSASGNGEGSYTPVTTASSPKQTSSLLNTPQTVTVIPQAIIREQGATNLTEVLRNTPGITFDAGENGFATSTNNFKIAASTAAVACSLTALAITAATPVISSTSSVSKCSRGGG